VARANALRVRIAVDRKFDRVYYDRWRVPLFTLTGCCIDFYILREVYLLRCQAVNYRVLA
jgi:hypothetical protein